MFKNYVGNCRVFWRYVKKTALFLKDGFPKLRMAERTFVPNRYNICGREAERSYLFYGWAIK